MENKKSILSEILYIIGISFVFLGGIAIVFATKILDEAYIKIGVILIILVILQILLRFVFKAKNSEMYLLYGTSIFPVIIFFVMFFKYIILRFWLVSKEDIYMLTLIVTLMTGIINLIFYLLYRKSFNKVLTITFLVIAVFNGIFLANIKITEIYIVLLIVPLLLTLLSKMKMSFNKVIKWISYLSFVIANIVLIFNLSSPKIIDSVAFVFSIIILSNYFFESKKNKEIILLFMNFFVFYGSYCIGFLLIQDQLGSLISLVIMPLMISILIVLGIVSRNKKEMSLVNIILVTIVGIILMMLFKLRIIYSISAILISMIFSIIAIVSSIMNVKLENNKGNGKYIIFISLFIASYSALLVKGIPALLIVTLITIICMKIVSYKKLWGNILIVIQGALGYFQGIYLLKENFNIEISVFIWIVIGLGIVMLFLERITLKENNLVLEILIIIFSTIIFLPRLFILQNLEIGVVIAMGGILILAGLQKDKGSKAVLGIILILLAVVKMLIEFATIIPGWVSIIGIGISIFIIGLIIEKRLK